MGAVAQCGLAVLSVQHAGRLQLRCCSQTVAHSWAMALPLAVSAAPGRLTSNALQVDVTVTAKADQPWLWGVKSAVEAVFITQAKDDILSFLEYNLRLFKELHRTLQVTFSALRPPCLKIEYNEACALRVMYALLAPSMRQGLHSSVQCCDRRRISLL